MKPHRTGFTLIELLIVVSIIGILVALMFPAMQGVLGSAAEVQCQNNLAQLAKVIVAYCQQYDGSFPNAAQRNVAPSARDWLLGGVSDLSGNPNYQPSHLELGVLVRAKLVSKGDIFYCPLDVDAGLTRANPKALKIGQTAAKAVPPTSYVINGSITYGNKNWGSLDAMTARRVRRHSEFDPIDFLFIEESEKSLFDKPWMEPDPSGTNYNITSRHRGGGFVSCMDGHVEWMRPGLPPDDEPGKDNFKQEMEKAGSGNWWEKTGTRWNPG